MATRKPKPIKVDRVRADPTKPPKDPGGDWYWLPAGKEPRC